MVTADKLMIYDSADTSQSKAVTFGNFKSSLYGPALRLTMYSSMPSVSASTWTDIQWDEAADTDTMFDSGTSRVNFTINTSGYYALHVRVGSSAATTSGKMFKINVYNVTDTASSILNTYQFLNFSGEFPVFTVNYGAYLTAGKTYKIRVYQDDSTISLNPNSDLSGLTLVWLRG